MSKDIKETRRSLPHTKPEQVEILVGFLENNHKAMMTIKGESGGKNAPVQSGTAFADNKKVFEAMAEAINRKCKFTDESTKWDYETARNRWGGIYRKYTDAVSMSRKTGEGVDSTKDGDDTFEDKMEHMCPCFGRLDALFGSRQSVRPHNVSALGVVKKDKQNKHEEEDDEQEEAKSGDDIDEEVVTKKREKTPEKKDDKKSTHKRRKLKKTNAKGDESLSSIQLT